LTTRRNDLAIVGATATGKSALALAIAALVSDVELVSVDSMAVYRGMDIGTETPPPTHAWHLVDIADPGEEFSVASFQAAAREVLAGIRGRRHRAIFVGGTGLYHRAVIDQLELPGRFPDLARRLEAAAAEDGLLLLYERLAAVDPLAASRIEPGNHRRIVRALEVTLGSGRPFSSFGPGLESYEAASLRLAGLTLPRDEIDRRLEQRLDDELAAGWVEEVRRLAARPRPMSRTARQAIGYEELFSHLAGDISLADAKASTLKRLKSFARRQESWFRRDPRVVWFDSSRPDLVDAVLSWWDGALTDAEAGCETVAQ
jgi:tRNA dimethylallyltransferase